MPGGPTVPRISPSRPSLHTSPLKGVSMWKLRKAKWRLCGQPVDGRAGWNLILPSRLFIAQGTVRGEVRGTPMAVWHQPLDMLTGFSIGT